MSSAIDFFLSYHLHTDAKGWEWRVSDSERLHQDIIHMLIKESAKFSEALIGHSGTCARQPQGTLFDLSVEGSTGPKTYIEIKVDQPWTQWQRQRQVQFLQDNEEASGVLLLLSQSAVKYTWQKVSDMSNGRFKKISYGGLLPALDVIDSLDVTELREFAAAYSRVLIRQKERATKIWTSNHPDD